MEVYGNHPNETYLSVMVNDGRAARGRHRILPSEWSTVRAELEASEDGSLDPDWFSSSGTGDGVRYACVWLEREDPLQQKNTLTGLGRTSFESNHEELRRDGGRLISASVHGTPFNPVFAGFFTRGIQPEWEVRTGLTSSELEEQVVEQENRGWEVDVVTAYEDFPIRRYIAVFKRDPYRTFRVQGESPPFVDAVDEAMETYMRRGLISRGAVAVTDSDGRLIAVKAYTFDAQDVENTSVLDEFRFASVSKSLTAMAVMALIEDDPTIELTDPVSETLDDWDWCGVSCGACVIAPCNDRYWPEITWHHLLQHYAGFERDPMGQDREVRDVLSAILPGPSLTLPVSLENIHEYMRRFGVEMEPGLDHHYSNYGYSLLGRLIERVSGMSYEEYVQTRILDRLCIDRMRIGSAFPTENEVGYEDSRHRLRLTVMSEDEETWVPRTAGGFNLANYDSLGGWTGTVVDFAAVLASISTVSNSPILCSSSIETMFTSNSGEEGYENVASNRGHGWNLSTQYAYHEGSLPGTRAMVWRRSNGRSYTVVFNRRNRDAYGPEIHRKSDLWDEALAVDDIRTIFNQLYATSPIFEWESELWPDLFGSYLPCASTEHCQPVLGDLNGDRIVDAADLGLLIGGWGTDHADLNEDGTTDSGDLGLLIANWTTSDDP